MNNAPKGHFVPGQRPGQGRGATALGSDAEGRPHHHSRHMVGNTLRVAKVFASSAFDVIVLGDLEGGHPRPPRPGKAGESGETGETGEPQG